jgi:2-haloacid dehalogenase
MSGPAHYQPFWDITRNALKFSAEKLGLALSAEGEVRLMNQYRHLSAFPENREVLQALKGRGVRTGILSNGDPEMLAVAVKSAGLTELLDDVLSVHATQRYKTDPAAYQVGVDAVGLPPKEILFVSSNGWDAIGATWFGYTTLWVNRAAAPLEQLNTAPTRMGHSLRDTLSFFPS